MEKFEVGDKVKVVRLDTTRTDYVSDLKKYLGCVGTIRDTQIIGSELMVEFDNGASWWFYPDWLELVEKKQKGWTGKVIVVDIEPNAYYTPSCFTSEPEPGQVYTVEDGHIKITPYYSITPYLNSTFEDIWNWFRGRNVEVIEFKGLCKNGKE